MRWPEKALVNEISYDTIQLGLREVIVEKEETNKTKSEYIPGVCNIGPAERRARRMVGLGGLGITIVLWAIFIFVHVPQIWRFFIFLPASMGATGFLQSAFHFCVGFGMKGVFNFGPVVGKTDTVMEAEFRKKDRQKALFILFLSVMIGVAVALAAVVIKI
jgi:hypothetical protein